MNTANKATCSIFDVVLALVMVTFGAGVVTTKKISFLTKAKGLNDKMHPFRKPCFQVLLLQTGEACCLIYYFIMEKLVKKKSSKEERVDLLSDNELDESSSTSNSSSRSQQQRKTGFFHHPFVLLVVRMIIPTVLDLCCSNCGAYAILLSPPSLMEVLTCTNILFSPFWNCLILKRRYKIWQILSILVALGGATLAATSSFYAKHGEAENPSLGAMLMIIAQLCSSVQYAIEERLMLKRHYSPALAMGTEGVIGIIIQSIVLLILTFAAGQDSFDPYLENTRDTFIQLSNSGSLRIVVSCYFIVAHVFLFTGINIARRFSSLHRVLLSAAKAAVVWIVWLILYPLTDHKYGETWEMPGSILQLFGFILLVTGNICFQAATLHIMKKAQAEKAAKVQFSADA